jgi:putative transposase
MSGRWLTVAELAKKENVSVRTIQRRIRNGYYLAEHIKEIPSNGRGGISYKIFLPTYDTEKISDSNSPEIPKKTYDTPQGLTTTSDRLTTKPEKMSEVKNETYDTENETYDKKGTYDKIEGLTTDNDINLTGQEKKPELNHSGADSSPAPTPSEITKEVTIFNKNELQAPQFIHNPEPEVPDHYKRIGQLRATLCNYVIKLSKTMPKADALKKTVELYNFGEILPDLQKHKPDSQVSVRTVQRWLSRYKKGDNDFFELIPNYSIGHGAITVTEDEENFLIHFYLLDSKPSIGSIISNMKTKASLNKIDSPTSSRTLRRWLDRYIRANKKVVKLMREGEKTLRDLLLPYIERDDSLLEPGDVFVSDGNTLNFLVIDPESGKAKRMIFVPVMDWASRVIVGGSIATTEDSMNIANAYRNSFLNYGGVPRVMYLDNGRAFKSKYFISKNGKDLPDLEDLLGGLFSRLGIEEHFARAYNARSKVIERWFKTFNEQFERFINSYIGASISDKPAHLHRNEKWLLKLANDEPLTYQEAQLLISHYIENYYHNRPHSGLGNKTPKQVYLSKPCPEERQISASHLDYLMLKHEARQVGRNGVEFLKMHFWHPKISDFVQEKVLFRYDPNNVSYIQVYTLHGKFICTATPKEKTHPMLAIDPNRAVSEKLLKKEIQYQNKIVKDTRELAQKTLSKTQYLDDQLLDHISDNNLFDSPTPKLPQQTKSLDEKMIDQIEAKKNEIPVESDTEPIKIKEKTEEKINITLQDLGLGK